MEAERLDARRVALAALVFLRLSRATDRTREPSARCERDAARRREPQVRTRPYPAVRGVYTVAGLGVLGALAEFSDQLLG